MIESKEKKTWKNIYTALLIANVLYVLSFYLIAKTYM